MEKGADLHAKDFSDRTPLLDTAANDHLEVVKWLTEHGADIHAEDKKSWAPTHYAAARGHLEVLKC